jgi:hypothetical protein
LVDPDEVLDADDVAQNLRPPGPWPVIGEVLEEAFVVARPTTTVSPGFSSPEATCVKRPSEIPVRISTGAGSPRPVEAIV